MSAEEMKRRFEEELEKQKAELQKPNLAVVGGTGVGKSSLINRIFGKKIAAIGNGEPVTRGMNRIEAANIVFYDTEGYEITSEGIDNSNFETNVKAEILEMGKQELKKQIHLVWYCISISNHRVTEYDLNNITWFVNHNMNTAVVFTQCDNDEEGPDGKGVTATEFAKIIHEKIAKIPCFETCGDAQGDDLKLDLEKLIQWSQQALPNEQLRQSFVAAQLASIDTKKSEAYKIVMAAAASATTAAGLNPLPLSDAFLLAPIQLGMCIKIGHIFFGSVEGISALLKTQVMSILGKQAATSLSKLIPILGNIVNAGVAGALTYALGTAITEIYAKAYEEMLRTGKLPDWAEILNSSMFNIAFNKGREAYKK